MSEAASTVARGAVVNFWGLVVQIVLLGVCAGTLCCSPSEETGPVVDESDAASPDSDAALPEAYSAVPYWSGVWGKLRHDEPMYLRLPAGIDTREWEAMHEGYVDYIAGTKRFNRPAKDNYEGDYEFTWDVFTWNIPLWRRVLAPFVGQPDLNYLEIGVAEGRATLWMLENVLTHPTSRATVIDPFMVEGHEERLRENLKRSPGPDRVQLIKAFSQDVLSGLEPDSFDIIYIDGSNLAGDVLLDAVYTWRLLKDGGVVIHDDYMQNYSQPPEMHPLFAVDAFITGRRNTVEVLHRGRQIVLRKLPLELPAFCWTRDPCLRVGNHLYAWKSDRLLEVGTNEEVPLSKRESLVLQQILRSRRIGAEAELVLEQDIAAIRARSPRVFQRLAELLDLRILSSSGPRQASRTVTPD